MLLALVACSGDDELTGYVPHSETISIVKNDLLFSAQGGSATVEIQAGETATAQTDATWATASVSGKVITVTAEANTHYEGRTAMLLIRAGKATRQLPIQQRGVIVGTLPVESRRAAMEGEHFTYTIAHDMPMVLTTSEEWIHATMEGDVLSIDIDANESGHMRRGMLMSECNQQKDTMAIVQYDMQNDVVGSYYMIGYNGGIGGAPVATHFDVVLHNDELCWNWPGQDLWRDRWVPLRFDASTCTIFFPSAIRLYESGSSYDIAYFYDTNGIIATSNVIGADARLDYDERSHELTTLLTASNWPGHELGGFIIRSSRAGGMVVSTLLQIAQPRLMRVGPPGTTLNE